MTGQAVARIHLNLVRWFDIDPDGVIVDEQPERTRAARLAGFADPAFPSRFALSLGQAFADPDLVRGMHPLLLDAANSVVAKRPHIDHLELIHRSRPAGSLLRTMTAGEKHLRDSQPTRTAELRDGMHVTLWQVPGTWSIWSKGPAAGTWWLAPLDPDARAIIDGLRERPDGCHPVASSASSYLLTHAREIRRPGLHAAA